MKQKTTFNNNWVIPFFFFGIGLTILFGRVTLIHSITIIVSGITFILIGYVLPRKYYKRKDIGPNDRLLISIFGFGPALTSLFLLLNYVIPVQHHQERYEIVEKVEIIGSDPRNPKTIIYLIDDKFESYRKARKFNSELVPEDARTITYRYHVGLFGFKIIDSRFFDNINL